MPASALLPPFCDWPEDLAALVRGGWTAEGGHEYDGRLFMPLDEAAITRAAGEMKAAGLKSVGISAIFSAARSDPRAPRRRALVTQVILDAVITCSSDLGRIGLLERENAALLNAALADLSRETIAAFEKAIKDSGHCCAAVHHPERRHRRGGRSGAAPAGLQLRLGRDQFDARRGLPVGPRRCRR